MSTPMESLTLWQRPSFTPEVRAEFRRLYEAPINSGDAYWNRIVRIAHFGQAVGVEGRLSPSQVAVLMREEAWEMLPPGDPRRGHYEVAVYAGCQHAHVLKDMQWIQTHPPDYLLASDLGGSDFITDTQKLFYNGLFNHVRSFLRNVNDGSLAAEVAKRGNAILSLQTEEGRTVLDGYHELLSYVTKAYPMESTMPQAQDTQAIVRWIGVLAHRTKNHGFWLASLGRDTRQGILDDIASKTKTITEKLVELKRAGTRVIVGAGNWDDPDTLDLIARKGRGPDDGEITDYFDTIDYLRGRGFEVYTELGSIETDTTFTIVAPFRWILVRFDRDAPQYRTLMERARLAKIQGKLVVLYPHAALHLEDSKANRDVADRTRQMIVDFGAIEVAHGHDHREPNYGKDEYPVYEYRGGAQAYIVYMPLREIAVSIRRRRKPQRIGHTVLPARRI